MFLLFSKTQRRGASAPLLPISTAGQKVLQRGVKLTGATVHFVTEICDGGPIILQKAVEVRNDDTPEILQRRVMEEAEWKLLPEAVSLFCEGRLTVCDGRAYIDYKEVSK